MVDADVELAWMAGRLRKATAEAGLSLGDRFCLALAAREGLPAWTADRQWRSISNRIDVEVVVIRVTTGALLRRKADRVVPCL